MEADTETRDARWQAFLAHHRLDDLWATTHESEGTKYGQMVKEFEAEAKARKESEERIVEARRSWAVRSRHFSRKRRQQCQACLDELFATADKVQLAWAARRSQKAAFEKASSLVEQPVCSATSWFHIRLGDFLDHDARETRVHTTLHQSRYYFERAGGSYILRHDAPAAGPGDPSWDPCQSMSWEKVGWESLLRINEDELPRNYTFTGLVPRSTREYAARFGVVCPKAVRLLASLVLFGEEARGRQIASQLATYPETAAAVTAPRLVELHDMWANVVRSDTAMLCWAREKTRTHPLVLECAYLLDRIGRNVEGFMHLMLPLAWALQLATGVQGRDLMDEYDKAVGREALDELLRKRNVGECLLISSAVHENIHDFFSASRFEADPVHPLNRFSFLDAQPTLDKLDALSQLLDDSEQGDFFHSDPALSTPPGSDTELRDQSHPPKVEHCSKARDADTAAEDDILGQDAERKEEGEKKEQEKGIKKEKKKGKKK